jgi:putative intracellular protease/amidase
MKVGILLAKSENNAQNFNQVFQVCKTIFSVVKLLTSDGESPQFDKEIEELKDLEYENYKDIDLVKNDLVGLIIPDGTGHYDHSSRDMKPFLYSFIKFKKPICLIATGCGVLLATGPDLDESWILQDYCMTSPSNLDLLKSKSYDKYPSLEEFIFLHFGQYSASIRQKNYIVIGTLIVCLIIDDHLITAQNQASTLTAIQTFILLCNQ